MAFSLYAWSVLAFHLGVIVWGAYVRATGSGAGCGGHWPLCNGQVIPRAPQIATVIEFTHRATSGLALVLVALLLFLAFRVFAPGHIVRRMALLATAFTVSEALLGAALVLLGYVARNTSLWRGATLGVHLVNTLLLLASLALTAWFAAGRDAGSAGLAWRPRLRPIWTLSVAALLLTGVSGAITALGDTLFASSTLGEGLRMDFSASAHPFVRVRILHPLLAAALSLGVLMVALKSLYVRGASRTTVRLAALLIALTALQLCLGVADMLLMAPVWLQLLHLLGADLLVITFVLLSAQRGQAQPSPERTRLGRAV